MVEYKSGNIFDSGAQVLVNPVNCVGVMGKGLALEFKRRFPWIMPEYEMLCRSHRWRPGMVHRVMPLAIEGLNAPGIMLFATKDHWRQPSKLDWIENGLWAIWGLAEADCISSIALPWLGCGLGGLKTSNVRSLYDKILGSAKLEATVYTPE